MYSDTNLQLTNIILVHCSYFMSAVITSHLVSSYIYITLSGVPSNRFEALQEHGTKQWRFWGEARGATASFVKSLAPQ